MQDAVRNERRPEHDDGAGRGAVRAGDLMRRTLFAEHHRAEFFDRVSGGHCKPCFTANLSNRPPEEEGALRRDGTECSQRGGCVWRMQ